MTNNYLYLRSIIGDSKFATTVFMLTLVFASAILGSLLILANPGYYNHDELQIQDFIDKYGFVNYLEAYVTLKKSAFGSPDRPWTFLILGVIALFMKNYPFLAHLEGVLSNAVAALLLCQILLRFGLSKNKSILSAILFAVNPISVFSAGILGGLNDRWYVIFVLCIVYCAQSYFNRNDRLFLLVLMSVFSMLAVLSKETAVVLPGLMFLFVLLAPDLLKRREFYKALGAVSIPIIFYLAYRYTALADSLKIGSASYSLSISNFQRNFFYYTEYPLLLNVAEPINIVFSSLSSVLLAFLLHASLLLVIGLVYGVLFCFGYIYLYFIFLLPVLFLNQIQTPYMYASLVPMSVALGALLFEDSLRTKFLKIFPIFIVVLLIAHSVSNQLFIYKLGLCMNKLMVTLESSYAAKGRPDSIRFHMLSGSEEHVLRRVITGRDKIGDFYPIKMSIENFDGNLTDQNALNFNASCYVY